jgi:hypothetical protein
MITAICPDYCHDQRVAAVGDRELPPNAAVSVHFLAATGDQRCRSALI